MTIETSIRGETEAPEFNKWPKMLLDGLKIFIVGLVYGTGCLIWCENFLFV